MAPRILPTVKASGIASRPFASSHEVHVSKKQGLKRGLRRRTALSLIFSACSFGLFPLLWSHASILDLLLTKAFRGRGASPYRSQGIRPISAFGWSA